MNGIASTNTLVSDGHTHDAATAARNYSTARPDGVSEWFLPSIGQWGRIINGLAGKSTALTGSTNNSFKAAEVCKTQFRLKMDFEKFTRHTY